MMTPSYVASEPHYYISHHISNHTSTCVSMTYELASKVDGCQVISK